MQIPGFMTLQEAADYLQLSKVRVRQLRDEKRLTSEKVGRTVLVTRESVERYERERKAGGWPKGKPRKSGG